MTPHQPALQGGSANGDNGENYDTYTFSFFGEKVFFEKRQTIGGNT
jgi:hypothetical protein